MNIVAAEAHLRAVDPVMGRIVETLGPCTLASRLDNGDLFFALASSIVYQQLSTKAAGTIWGRFAGLFPDPLIPDPLLLQAMPDEQLRGVGLSRQKIGYLRDLALHAPSLPTLDGLADLDNEAIISALTRVKGVGRWTVQMLLIFRLGREDVLPVDDLGVQTGAQLAYSLTELPKKKVLEALAAPW